MRCEVCELRCEISNEYFGRCGMYCLKDGQVSPRYDDQVSSFTVSRIEDVPILHFYPGSLTMTVGTASCNFDCAYCENSYIAREPAKALFRYRLTPEELVKKAVLLECKNIAFTVNEPTVSFPYFLEVAKAARKAGLKVGCASNGYFTVEAINELAEHLDFANISVKSLRDKFYQDVCHVPSVKPVLRNIRILHEKSVHVEVTTPIAPSIDEDEAKEIAREIAAINKNIPWHIFWLLPEYKMEDGDHVPVEKLIKIRQNAKEYLNYVFIGNLVGSDWLDTTCPTCNSVIIKRLNALGCGCQLVNFHFNDNKCPECGGQIHIKGEWSLSFAEEKDQCTAQEKTEKPALGLLDVHGYQKLFDFRNGERVKCSSPLLSEVGELIHNSPYPGDEKPESDTWVTDLALKMVDLYEPDLVMLDYAQAWFLAMNQSGDLDAAFQNVFSNVKRFLDNSGYTPMVIGLGGLEKVEKIIDMEALFKSTELTVSNGKYAHFSRRAYQNVSQETLQELEKYWHLLTKQEYLDGFTTNYSKEFADSVSEYIAVAKPGVSFKGMSSMSSFEKLTNSLDKHIPVYTTITPPTDLTQVAPIVSEAVCRGKKVALIMLEGVGLSNFPFPTVDKCQNHDGHFICQLQQQYITISTGVPYSRSEYRFPLGKDYWMKDYRPYPFSARFYRYLNNTINKRIGNKKSISVGNRNIMTHVCLEADISVECYCCFRHNFGTMAVFQQEAFNSEIKPLERNGIKSHV